MRTVSIFKNGKNQAIRLPKDMEFNGLSELEIVEEGDTIILRPTRLVGVHCLIVKMRMMIFLMIVVKW